MKIRDLYLNLLASNIFIHRKLRYILYRIYGLKINTANISPRCFIGGKNLIVGKGTFINYNCFFDTSDKIEIGENCSVGFKNTFITSTHKIGETNKRALDGYSKPILIKDGCWIGANSTILPGVTIGKGCIIGAGSVVVKDCEENCLYAGNPAKKIKKLE